MPGHRYIMEAEDEAIRLDLKTDPGSLQKQARRAGIRPGLRVGDLGCGPGKTTFYLNRLVQPGGSALGIDISPRRIRYAEEHYSEPGLEFAIGDIRETLAPFGLFDFIWIRFVLEHYRSSAFEIVKNVCSALKPGGILYLADLDYNCLTHFGLPPGLESCLKGLVNHLEERADFDPYAGRKLYSYLFDLRFTEIEVDLSPHHLIYGPIRKTDLFNWTRKLEIAARHSGYPFREFEDGFDGFFSGFNAFFRDPRRFTYTPIISCYGKKPH